MPSGNFVRSFNSDFLRYKVLQTLDTKTIIKINQRNQINRLLEFLTK